MTHRSKNLFGAAIASASSGLDRRLDDDVARTLIMKCVSRETFERLDVFVAMLRDWNVRLNLVGDSTMSHVWQRHVLDSAQLLGLPSFMTGKWLDIGTGGGFPGMVLAIIGKEYDPGSKFVLLEANERKSLFLQRVASETGTYPEILTGRAEDVEPQVANRISARAVSPLNTLLALVYRHLDYHGLAVLPKGEHVDKEIDVACMHWDFDLKSGDSVAGNGRILMVSNIMPKAANA